MRRNLYIFGGSALFLALVIGVWMLQLQQMIQKEAVGGVSEELGQFKSEIEAARAFSAQIEESLPRDALELELLPRLPLLNDAATQEELATSIEAEMQKRRFGTLPVAEDRPIEEPTE